MDTRGGTLTRMSSGHRATPWLLSAPALLLFLIFVAAPLLMIAVLSLLQGDHAGGAAGPPTLANWRTLLGDDYYLAGLWRSLRIAVWVAALSLALGMPEAFVLSRMRPAWRGICLVVVLGPLLISIVVRTLGWALLLGSSGIVNNALMWLGLTPVSFLYTETGVVIALVHVFSPFMVLAVWTSLQGLDPDLEWAAASLGASRLRVLYRIVLPQISAGIVSGTVTVFALAASAFATPAIIGGRRLKVASMLAYDEFLGTLDWPLGAALAVMILIGIGAIVGGVGRLAERRDARSAA
jgi:putative spermidine/putrescine transport system permease protein